MSRQLDALVVVLALTLGTGAAASADIQQWYDLTLDTGTSADGINWMGTISDAFLDGSNWASMSNLTPQAQWQVLETLPAEVDPNDPSVIFAPVDIHFWNGPDFASSSVLLNGSGTLYAQLDAAGFGSIWFDPTPDLLTSGHWDGKDLDWGNFDFLGASVESLDQGASWSLASGGTLTSGELAYRSGAVPELPPLALTLLAVPGLLLLRRRRCV